MKSILLSTAIVIVFLSSAFQRLKHNNTETTAEESKVVLGMALLNSTAKIDFNSIINELQQKYKLTIADQEIDEQKGVAVFRTGKTQLAIMLMNMPVPAEELDLSTQISYLWPEAKELLPKHKAHVIISVSSSDDTKLTMYKTFTKLAAVVLGSTKAIGIYLGSQTLVLPTDLYLEGANSMTDDSLPLMNWIYFGLRVEKGKISAYTYGLKEFGLDEMEILNSKHSEDEIFDLLYNMSHYVILGSVTLKAGETIGMTEDQKLKITKSKGVFLDGATLKIGY